MGHTIVTIFLPRNYCQKYTKYPRVGFCLSTIRCDGASSTRHHYFPGVEGARLPSTLWPPNSPDLNPADYSLWSILKEKVYRSRIDNVTEFKTRLINKWARFDQPIVDAPFGQ